MRHFPPYLARLICERIRQPDKEELIAGRKARRFSFYPAYRMDGALKACYDPYCPTYPEDAEPGIATVIELERFSVAGHREPPDQQLSDFTPMSELLRDYPRHAPERRASSYDALGVTLVTKGDNVAFLWSLDEEQLEAWTDKVPADVHLSRLQTFCHAMDNGEAPNLAVGWTTKGSREVHVASSPEAMEEAIRNRLPLGAFRDIEPGRIEELLEAVVANFVDKGGLAFWQKNTVPEADFLSAGGPPALRRIEHFNRDAIAMWGRLPVYSAMKQASPISVAAISNGEETVLVHAANRENLNWHIARAIEKLGTTLSSATVDVADGFSYANFGEYPRLLEFLYRDGEPPITGAYPNVRGESSGILEGNGRKLIWMSVDRAHDLLEDELDIDTAPTI